MVAHGDRLAHRRHCSQPRAGPTPTSALQGPGGRVLPDQCQAWCQWSTDAHVRRAVRMTNTFNRVQRVGRTSGSQPGCTAGSVSLSAGGDQRSAGRSARKGSVLAAKAVEAYKAKAVSSHEGSGNIQGKRQCLRILSHEGGGNTIPDHRRCGVGWTVRACMR